MAERKKKRRAEGGQVKKNGSVKEIEMKVQTNVG